MRPDVETRRRDAAVAAEVKKTRESLNHIRRRAIDFQEHTRSRQQYAREEFLRGRTTCHLVTTDKMMGDGKTKVVDRTKCFKCRQNEMNE